MSTRVFSPNITIIMDALPTSGSLPEGSANQANPPRQFIFGAGLNLRRNSTELSTSTSEVPNVSGQPRHKAVRCLFGSPDPKSGQFARDKVREIQEADMNKWEFDFVKDKPLDDPKRFIWEAVRVKSGSSYFATTESGNQSKSSTSTITSTTAGSISKSKSVESDSLLIVRSVTSTLTSSSPTCPPPPCKQSSPERRLSLSTSPTPPEREHHLQLGPVTISRSSFTHLSSSSSQSSPEISEDVNVNHLLAVGLPSPPSSMEEDNCNVSGPSSPVETSNTKATTTSKSTVIGSPQSRITDFMQKKKRRAGSEETTTAGTGCGSPPPEKKTSL